MKPTLRFYCYYLALFYFSTSKCDDIAALITLEVQDFVWKGLIILPLAR
jgi:hypothetical protein